MEEQLPASPLLYPLYSHAVWTLLSLPLCLAERRANGAKAMLNTFGFLQIVNGGHSVVCGLVSKHHWRKSVGEVKEGLKITKEGNDRVYTTKLSAKISFWSSFIYSFPLGAFGTIYGLNPLISIFFGSFVGTFINFPMAWVASRTFVLNLLNNEEKKEKE